MAEKEEERYIVKEYKVYNLVNDYSKYDLSIIIPCFNVEDYIERCLNSVLNQKTNFSFEIICINDGSTDQTLTKLRKYGQMDKRIKVYNQENIGISNTRNRGLKLAQGEYIAFVDSDDYIDENFVDIMLSKAKNGKAEYVKCGYVIFSDNNKRKKIKRGKKIECINKKLNEKILKINGYMWGAVIKKSIFKDICFPPNYWFEDMIIRMLILRKCKSFIYIKNCLYYYNNRINSATKIQGKIESEKNLDQLYLVKKIYDYSRKINLKDDKILYELIIREWGYILSNRTRNMPEKDRKAIFYKACELWNFLDIKNKYKFSVLEKVYIYAFSQRKFWVWNMVSAIIISSRRVINILK